jgi:Cu-processing system permease protein
LLIGLGLPSLLFGTVSMIPLSLLIIFTSVLVTAVFSNIAFFAGAVSQDKVRALTFVIFIWLFFAVMYDGIILFATVYFYEYPIEIPALIFSALNPLDLARIILLLHIDHSALMGYTGALYKSVFSGTLGMSAAFLLLAIWFTVPFLSGIRVFNRRDF